MDDKEDVSPLINFYSSHISDEFNNLSKPLNNIGLDGFFYTTIASDGAYFCISNFIFSYLVFWCFSYFFEKKKSLKKALSESINYES